MDESALGMDMDAVLEGRLVVGPCAIVTFQGPKGNEAKEIWLVTKGLIVMLGRMEDELFDPSGGF